MTKVFKTFVAAVAGFAAMSTAAFAEDAVRVSYADLDLTQPADAATFKARTDASVKAYCDANALTFSATGTLLRRSACEKSAKAAVRMSLPNEQRRQLQIAASRAAEQPIEVATR